MSNIAKLKKCAGEYEQKKQFDKALSAYLEILEELGGRVDEADVVLLNRVGDLLLRQGNVGQAVTFYEQALELYMEGGFFNNAIALCSKIRRTAPERHSVYYKLGQISARKGFFTDAKQHFLEYADRMQRIGDSDEALRALRECADLCPDQDDVRLLLAERLLKEDRKSEAVEQLQSLYDTLVAGGRSAEARAAAERMKAIDPDVMPRHTPASRASRPNGLVYLDLGFNSGAGGRTMTPSDSAPALPPVVSESAEQSSEAAAPLELSLLETDYGRSEWTAPDLGPGQPVGGGESGAPPQDQAEVPLIVLEHSSFEVASQEDVVAPLADLEPTALRASLAEEPRGAADALHASEEDSGPLLLDAFELPEMLEDDAPAPVTPLMFIPADDVPPLLAGGAERAAAAESSVAIDDPAPEGITAAPASDPATPAPAVSAAPAAGSPIELHHEQTAFLSARSPTPRGTAASDQQTASLLIPDRLEPPPEGSWARHFAGEPPPGGAGSASEFVRLEAAMREHEEAGDFVAASLLGGRLLELEPDSVRLHQKAVEHAFRANDRARLVKAYGALADCLSRGGEREKARAVYVRIQELDPGNEGARAALGMAGGQESSAVACAYGSTVPSASALAPAPVESVTADPASEAFVDLAEWFREDEPVRSTRMVVDVPEPVDDDQMDFAETLCMFKQGVAANLDESDFSSHYDLGIAYKEMGLVDEAIAEFQKALRGPEQRVRTYEALGQCFIEKGQPQIAATILSRALSEKGYTDDMLVGVLYLLGEASEALQKWSDAVGYYERVFAVDIQFRDVGERLMAAERSAK